MHYNFQYLYSYINKIYIFMLIILDAFRRTKNTKPYFIPGGTRNHTSEAFELIRLVQCSGSEHKFIYLGINFNHRSHAQISIFSQFSRMVNTNRLMCQIRLWLRRKRSQILYQPSSQSLQEKKLLLQQSVIRTVL